MVYSALVDTGLAKKRTGKVVMVCTFMPNTLTAVAFSFVFLKPNPYALPSPCVTAAFLLFSLKQAAKSSAWIFW